MGAPEFSFSCGKPDISGAVREMTTAFANAQLDSPRLCGELLLALALNIDRNALLKHLIISPQQELCEEAAKHLARLASRRLTGEPIAYITGVREFYGREFFVAPDTLIPRPETELLIDFALHYATESKGHFADFGTGSGCIGVTFAVERPDWCGIALDASAGALKVAQKNARTLGAGTLLFSLADFRNPPLREGSLDLLLTNPPYVSSAEYRAASPEVREFEPYSALVPQPLSVDCENAVSGNVPQCIANEMEQGGVILSNDTKGDTSSASQADMSGLEDAVALAVLAERLLRPGGRILMEIGCELV